MASYANKHIEIDREIDRCFVEKKHIAAKELNCVLIYAYDKFKIMYNCKNSNRFLDLEKHIVRRLVFYGLWASTRRIINHSNDDSQLHNLNKTKYTLRENDPGSSNLRV